MMKRFIATTAIVTLMLTSFAACSKKNDKADDTNTTITPTLSAIQNGAGENENNAEYITLGGYFSRDDANLSIFISDGSWMVNGVLFSADKDASTLILSGPLTYTEGADLVYEENGEKITFTFAQNSMKITTDSSTYAAFSGEYERMANTTIAGSGTIAPASGSTLELLGRVALTHYLTKNEGIPSCTFDVAKNTFSNDDMLDFIDAYADLFLSGEAQPFPEISTEYLCYVFSESDLNNLLLAATAGTFGIADLSVANSDIVLQDGAYYVPCRGRYAGGLATSYTEANPEKINEHLLLEAAIVKMDGTRYDIKMTLSTSENAKTGAAGIQIDSVTYEAVK